jgi:pilus assembly protein CpaF
MNGAVLEKRGKVFAVASAKGGVGKSVFAVNFAIALMRETKARVLLLDFDDVYCGDAGALLNVTQARRAATDLVPLLGSLSQQMLRGFLTPLETGIFYLPAFRRPEDRALLNEDTVSRTIDLLSRVFDIILIDLATGFGSFNIACLDQADHILLLLNQDLLSVIHTEKGLAQLQQLAFPRQMISFILNRFDSKGEFSKEIISTKIKIDILHVIPEFSGPPSQIQGQKMPLILAQPRHPFSKALDDLAAHLWEQVSRLPQPPRRPVDDHFRHPPVMATPTPDQRRAQTPASREKTDQINRIKLKIHERILEEMDLKRLEMEHFKDPKKFSQLKLDVKNVVDRLMDEEAHTISDRELRIRIVQEILSEALGLGPLETLLADPQVTEIMCNGPDCMYVEIDGKLQMTDIKFISEKHLRGAIERIVAPLGRRIDELSPMVDARLPDGSRVNAVISPLALDGPLLTIRKFPSKPLTIDDLVRIGSVNKQIAELFKFCVLAKLNILISGGTGSGKTTLLNILSGFIPSEERIVTIEDSAELQLKQTHVCRLESRQPSLEGTGEVTIRDLVRNALRMRPDRIVVGECRGAEALDMLQAMNTGHDGSMTTIHANSPRDALSRLETLVMYAGYELPQRAIREQVTAAIHLIVQQSRFPDGSRKITHISEITGMEGDTITLQDIFIYKQTGMDGKGRVTGTFVASGFIPRFMNTLEAKGFAFPREIFLESYS